MKPSGDNAPFVEPGDSNLKKKYNWGCCIVSDKWGHMVQFSQTHDAFSKVDVNTSPLLC